MIEFLMVATIVIIALAFACIHHRSYCHNIHSQLRRQFRFSIRTFGPGTRTAGVIDHIRKELTEIEQEPDDIEEWADLLLLSFDGAMRQGFTPEEIIQAMIDKNLKNESRNWPDWRIADRNKAIEHVRN